MSDQPISSDEGVDISFDVIDVLCVVDGQSLLEKYPDTSPERHQRLSSAQLKPYCRMITRERNALRGTNAQDDLIIHALEGDTIRWRATSLTADLEYRVDITDFYSFDDEEHIAAKPHQPDQESAPDLWQTEISDPMAKDTGSETYWLKFTVVPKEGKSGYFDWDPKIEAKKRNPLGQEQPESSSSPPDRDSPAGLDEDRFDDRRLRDLYGGEGRRGGRSF